MGLTPESLLNREVSGLGLVVKVLDSSRSFASEYSWDPTSLISESP